MSDVPEIRPETEPAVEVEDLDVVMEFSEAVGGLEVPRLRVRMTHRKALEFLASVSSGVYSHLEELQRVSRGEPKRSGHN